MQPWPQVAAIFTKRAESLDWLDLMSESNSVLSAILAVIHPELHHAGQETFNRLRQHDSIQPRDVLQRWTSAFSGVSVISNRCTPPHRDRKSRMQWYDMLVTLGRYRNCNLDLPGVGISLEYGPGTVVGLAGMALEHEVHDFEGDRVCYAYFMRDRVHEWAGVPADAWMKISQYK